MEECEEGEGGGTSGGRTGVRLDQRMEFLGYILH